MTRKRHTTKFSGIWFRLVDESNPDSQRRYIVWYVDGRGDEHTKTLPLGATLEDAKTYQARLHARRSDGDLLIPCRQTVSELLDEWLETRNHSLAVSSYDLYRWAIETHLKKEFGKRKVVDLSPSDVARFISRLQKEGKKAWTIISIMKPLKGAYELAVRDSKVASSPVTKLLRHERPKMDQREMRCLSGEELGRLLSKTSDPMWKALWAVLAYCGLRIGEALSLTWSDVSETSISIRHSKTKAGVREVPLPKAVRAILRAWKIRQSPGIPWVFAWSENGSCGPDVARLALHRARKAAGLPHFTPHELRHTYASILISRGVDLPTIAEQMGHKTPAITLSTYAHLYDKQAGRKKVLDALDDAMGGAL